MQDGRVEVVGKRLDTLTGKRVAVYRLVVEDEEKEKHTVLKGRKRVVWIRCGAGAGYYGYK